MNSPSRIFACAKPLRYGSAAYGGSVLVFVRYGKLPPMVSYWDQAPANDPLYVALKFSASMNTWAAGLSGASALCMALRLFLR
jgi:hypothetical protein